MVVTSDLLLNKGIELFKKYGYKKVTVDMICNEFNITKGSFYHHFRSKDELLVRWFKKLIEEMEDRLALDVNANPIKQLEKIYLQWAEVLENMGPELLHESLSAVNMQHDKELNKDSITPISIHAMSKMPRLSLDLIRLAQEQGYITNKHTPEQLYVTYTYAITGLCVNWYIESNSFNFKEEVQNTFKLIYGDGTLINSKN